MVSRPEADRDRLGAFLSRYAGTSLGPFVGLPDNKVLELAGGRAVVGYREAAGVLLTVGEPVAEPGFEETAFAELIDHCRAHRRKPALWYVSEEGAQRGRALGLQVLQVSEEATIPLADFTLAGKAVSNLRHSITRARREGVDAAAYDEAFRTPERDEQLHAISSAWVETKHGSEMGFTLGRFDPAELRFQEIHVAHVSGRIVAAPTLPPARWSS